jgi:hypothetical protein
LIVNVLVVGTAPTVDAVIASQIGAVALVPVPVDDKNILVVVIFPARLVGIPIALEYTMSPIATNGLIMPPKPSNVYSGMFNVEPTNDAAPLLPVVVNVIASCFKLKTIQSFDDKYPFCNDVATWIENTPVELLYNNGDVALNDVNPIAPVTSETEIVFHCGAAPTVPFPVIDKNFRVVVVFGATANGIPIAFE